MPRAELPAADRAQQHRQPARVAALRERGEQQQARHDIGQRRGHVMRSRGSRASGCRATGRSARSPSPAVRARQKLQSNCVPSRPRSGTKNKASAVAAYMMLAAPDRPLASAIGGVCNGAVASHASSDAARPEGSANATSSARRVAGRCVAPSELGALTASAASASVAIHSAACGVITRTSDVRQSGGVVESPHQHAQRTPPAPRTRAGATRAVPPGRVFRTSCASAEYCRQRAAAWLSVLSYREQILPRACGLVCRHLGYMGESPRVARRKLLSDSARCRIAPQCARDGVFQRRNVRRPTARRFAVRDAYGHAKNSRRSIPRAFPRGDGERVDRAPLVLHAQIASRLQRAPDLAGRSPPAGGVRARTVARRTGARSGRSARPDFDALRPRDSSRTSMARSVSPRSRAPRPVIASSASRPTRPRRGRRRLLHRRREFLPRRTGGANAAVGADAPCAARRSHAPDRRDVLVQPADADARHVHRASSSNRCRATATCGAWYWRSSD